MAGTWDPNAAWAPLQEDEAHDVGAAYGEIMSRGPVARVDEVLGGFWAVLSHNSLVEVALNTETFSNVVPLFDTRRPPLECDPPEHRFYRRLLNPFFARDPINALEPDVRRYAIEMLDPLLAAGEADLAEVFALPFPTRVLCRLLAAPDGDWGVINNWGKRVDQVGARRRPEAPSASPSARRSTRTCSS